ncbi:MAG TPA: hypothetical protein VFI03_01065 [Solirubrobacterales bacterium]|nr:hypothetical protein [Solirubrobacterales bacterium]
MRRFVLIVALIALAAALSVPGCGGDDEATITKAELIKKGDAICKKADKTQGDDYIAYARKSGDPGTTESNVSKFVFPPVVEQTEELEALGVPEGDEEKVDAIIAGIEEALKKSEAVLGKNPENFEAPFEEVSKLAADYGFEACSEIY